MLNRLLTALMIVSLAAAVAVVVLWWRADHGRSDSFHLGASSATQTLFYTLPDRLAVRQEQHDAKTIATSTRDLRMPQVFGGCLFIPGLWAAVRLRRRLRPRPPGWELPASGRR